MSHLNQQWSLFLKTSNKFQFMKIIEKGKSRQWTGKGAIRKRFPLQKPRSEKLMCYTMKTYLKPSEQLFSESNRWLLSYLNLTKSMKTYIRCKQKTVQFGLHSVFRLFTIPVSHFSQILTAIYRNLLKQ